MSESVFPAGSWRGAWPWLRRAFVVAAAIVAVTILSLFSIDLGPAVLARAEQEGTDYLKRPLHIGKLSMLLWPGRFQLDDVTIEGVSKTDEPFLHAKKILVNVTWSTLLSFGAKELYVDVEMTDWKMAIETWPGRPSSLPKLTPEKKSDDGPKRFSTTVRVTASRGQFTYRDHGTPWSVIAPNLNFNLVRSEVLQSYVGTAHFDGGIVQIQNFLPMATSLTTRFTLETEGGARVKLHHIDLVTDGARSGITGEVFLGDRWPEQHYQIDSRLSFSRMKELYFTHEAWRVAGDGRFTGRFDIPREGGYDLRGRFSSPLATLDTPGSRLQFPELQGALEWAPRFFAVTDASANLYGGRANFAYVLSPLGTPRPSTARFETDYSGVDLQTFFRAIDWQRIDLRGRATGHNEMVWENGNLKPTLLGAGTVTVTPPAGAPMAGAAVVENEGAAESAPFRAGRPLGPLPISGEVGYHFDPDGLDLEPSWVASASTYVSFKGRADYGAQSNLPFHVTSQDWQDSDRILAAILTAAGSPTGIIDVGGRGVFDGVFRQSFTRPRIEGTFNGADIRSWGVTWGRAIGDIVIENQFVAIKHATIDRPGGRTIAADGRFSLGFRRPEESRDELKDVHVVVTNWPLDDFRHAFSLNDWDVRGTVDKADIRLSGPYKGPIGDGTLRIGDGTAWGETFEAVTGDLAFNGAGLNASKIVMTKDAGVINGSALLKWDGTYAFDARGNKVPVESLKTVTVPRFPLSGVLQFTASGEGELDAPRYGFRFSVPDLSAGSQGIGSLSGAIDVRERMMTIQQLEVHSALLQGSGTGRIALNDAYDATLNFKFLNSRLDPYLPLVAPKLAAQLSQYTRAVIAGTLQIQGELKNTAALGIYSTVDQVELALSPTYTLTNDGPVRLAFENSIGTIRNLRLVGPETSLSIEGDIPRSSAPLQVTATGIADLAILKLLSQDVESSGAATINASFRGSMEQLNISGRADIANGRLRHRSFPHGIEQISGPIQFDADRITVADLNGRMAEGDVRFSGSVELNGLVPSQYNLRAEGRSMGLRYPSGFKSTVNASLALNGPVSAPVLSGDITVLRSIFLREIESDQAVVALMGMGVSSAGSISGADADAATSPVRLDLRIRAPSPSLRIETTSFDISGSANLVVRGTMDAPVVTGLVQIERGTGSFNGNRWTFRPSSIEFVNQTRMQPYFDVSFATRVRSASQVYDVTIRMTGQADHLDVQVNSDPYLPTPEIANLLLGERDVNTRRLESQSAALAAQNAQLAVRDLGLQLLAMPLSSRIGTVVQRTTPCDTFSLVPTLGNEAALLTPGARFTCGKRLSERVYLTYAHALSANNQYDVVLLEYEQSDRISWVLSRNEDRTFALDFRIRHVF